MSISRINRGNSIQRITGDASGVPNVITPRPATNLGNNLYEYVFPGTNSITFSNQVDPNTIQYSPNSRYIRTAQSGSEVAILVVGGGGGTLAPSTANPPGYGGGGGSGGVSYLSSGTIPAGESKIYAITIGGGGPGSPSTDVANLPGRLGTNSSFVGEGFNIIARGGGGGGTTGGPGGSGGGASWPNSTPVGQGTQPSQSQTAPSPVTNYGNPGGPSFPYTNFPSGTHNSSGGGGAGGPGPFTFGGGGGPGGPGVTLLGRTIGGGGGGRGPSNGSGGPGGGGTAGSSGGTANTGGGGGGGNRAGGSGIIVVRVQK
jgi:hypothetical protein